MSFNIEHHHKVSAMAPDNENKKYSTI